MKKFIFPTFKYKDYALSTKSNITCIFQYVILIYDQICDCSNDINYSYCYQKCQFKNDENLGFINLTKSQFKQLITDSEFSLDSSNLNDSIANKLLLILKNWFKKISNVKINFDTIKISKLKLYNVNILDNIIKNIYLHSNNIDYDLFHDLNQIIVNIEVDISNTSRDEIKQTKLNLTHINFLIYKYLLDTYTSCGVYLGDLEINQINIPFKKIEDDIANAYCHLYIVPLNLPSYYFTN